MTSRAFLDDKGRLGAISSYTGKLYKWGPEPTFCPGASFCFRMTWPNQGAVPWITREQDHDGSVSRGNLQVHALLGLGPSKKRILTAKRGFDIGQLKIIDDLMHIKGLDT